MPLDTSIAMGYKPPQMPNQLANYAQMQQIMGAQQSQEASQMQLEKMKRDEASLSTMMQAITAKGGPSDPMEAASAMIKSGIPHYMDAGLKLQQAAEQRKQFAAIMGGTPSAAPEAGGNALAPTAPVPAAPANALVPNAEVSAMRTRRNQLLALGTPQGIAAARALDADIALASKEPVYHNVAGVGLVDPRNQRVVMPSVEKTAVVAPPPKNIANINPNDFTPASIQRFSESGKYSDLISKKPVGTGEGAATKAPQGYRVTKSGDLEAIPGGPAAGKPLTESQLIKLRTDVSKDYKSASNTLSQMDDLLDSIEKVKTSPGLDAATGYTGKYLPSFSEGKAAQAETRIANLRGKVTALGKATAAMSGSIGSIANQEWKILADQIAVLDEVKGKKPLLEQIGLVEAQAQGAIERIRDAYEKTRSEDFERFPQFGQLPASRRKPAAPAGSGVDASNPLLK